MQDTGVSLIHNVLQFTTIKEQTLKIISSKQTVTLYVIPLEVMKKGD